MKKLSNESIRMKEGGKIAWEKRKNEMKVLNCLALSCFMAAGLCCCALAEVGE